MIFFPSYSYAQELELQVNQRIFSPGDNLVAFGRSLPNDAMIIELSNPAGIRVLRTQVDADFDGSFSKIMLVWPTPDKDKFFPGTYTLRINSGRNPDLGATEAMIFQSIKTPTPGVDRQLDVDVSVPSVMGRNETTSVIVQVTMNGVLVNGEPEESLDVFARLPDGSTKTINNFAEVASGVYIGKFRSEVLGQHIIHVEAVHQDLIANAVAGVFVEEGPILSLGSEISSLNKNVESLRQETVGKTRDIEEAVSNIGSASGQVASLLLPIIGMIAIIVALQATILARRERKA